jgi:alpha-tubulin suppressor-like RCC1 family protein
VTRRLLLGLVSIVAACSVKVPNGGSKEGNFPCEESSTCPAPDNACLVTMCLEEQCVFVPSPEGPTPEQKAGDCRETYCDGNGAVVMSPAPADLPRDDGNPCTESSCDGDAPRQLDKTAGTLCKESGVCNGAGKCGVCVPDERRCDGAAVTSCGADGQWGAATACATQKPVCSEGACIGVVELAAGATHACARFDDGSVRCWGDDARGQLGAAGLAEATVPPWASGFGAVSFGPQHACGLRHDKKVWCWGQGALGQLGDGQYAASTAPLPTQVAAVAVAVGTEHSCALGASGTVQCWGRNDRGQLGSGKQPKVALPAAAPPEEESGPMPPQPVAGVADATGLLVGFHHTCLRRKSGGPYCWGLFDYPVEPPDDPAAPPEPDVAKATIATPTAVAGVAGATELACGGDHCCALLGGGTVSCWGSGTEGELGNGGTSDSFVAVAVKGLAAVKHIGLGRAFGCALTSDGSIACWGANDAGQLGTAVDKPNDTAHTLANLGPATTLVVGDDFACALLQSGEVHCWGAVASNQPAPLVWVEAL